MTTYLDAILAYHRAAAVADTRPLDELIAATADLPAARGFAAALRASDPLGVISEVKRRSPSKGDLHVDLDAAALASEYEAGGAACCSVLTDVEFFGGSIADLQAARAAISIPVLRKDFTVSPRDVVDARLMGADCVLLIVAALDDAELTDFLLLATEVGLDALVEVHDEEEAERALTAGASVIGVNQRDLTTFEVDTNRAARVGESLPPDVVRVAESGISGPADIGVLVTAGFDAVLVGESLVTHQGPGDGVRALIDAAR
ncbi:MAG: indole-3-glycerol phosphate synthase TrpC [Acidimicrobiales bacterium]